MEENLRDILSNFHSEVDQQALLDYLQNKLSAGRQHEVELQLLQDPFTADALEGLMDIKNKPALLAMVEQLNRDLKKKTAGKKDSGKHRTLAVEATTVIAIVLILLFVVLGYFIIHRLKHP